MAKAKKKAAKRIAKPMDFRIVELDADFEPTSRTAKMTKTQQKLAADIAKLAAEAKAHERFFQALEELNDKLQLLLETVDTDRHSVELDGEPVYADEYGLGGAASLAGVWLPSSMEC